MDSRSEEEDIPLAKRRKYLQQERGAQINLPANDAQEEKTVSPDSDYIVILDDSEDDEEEININQQSPGIPASKPSLPSPQWPPIPLRPINYGSKSPTLATNPVSTNGTASLPEEIEQEEEEEQEIIELSSTTEEEDIDLDTSNTSRYYEEKELERARRVEQEVILLGHGSSDDERMRQQHVQEQLQKAPILPPEQKRSSAPPPTRKAAAVPSSTNRGHVPSRLNPSHKRTYSTLQNTTVPKANAPLNRGSAGQGRPARSTVLDTPFEFSTRETASEFKKSFTTPGNGVPSFNRSSPGPTTQAAIDKRTKEILHEMTETRHQKMQKSQVAWTQAAMKWREKNKPSEAELKRRAQEDSARASEAARRRAKITPSAHSARAARAAEAEASSRRRNGRGGSLHDNDPPPPRPAADAPELERRSYYRNIAQRKVSNASSFSQVLKLLGVPCDDPSQVKYSYRIAVRMFHPDSNSKEKVWNTPEEKVQAEEVMKIINERKEKEY